MEQQPSFPRRRCRRRRRHRHRTVSPNGITTVASLALFVGINLLLRSSSAVHSNEKEVQNPIGTIDNDAQRIIDTRHRNEEGVDVVLLLDDGDGDDVMETKASKPDNSCKSHQTCSECNAASWCHWCQDGACHEVGSIYGCLAGVDCNHIPKDANDTKHTDGPTLPPTHKPTKPDNSCQSHPDCDTCNAAPWCHWCPDDACYEIGSLHGCLSGVNCNSGSHNHTHPPTVPPTDKPTTPPTKPDNSCHSHQNCDECNAAPWCHWCPDDACHEIGSLHGCLSGVNCNSGSHNHTHPPTVPPTDKPTTSLPSSKPDNSCHSHQNCDECNAASVWCHWCPDNSCHQVGSVHGCFNGVTCHKGDDDGKKKHHDKKDNACNTHKTCSECALSSNLCHWCGHDDSCHSVGSIYGCLTGVDCYSADRCQRTEPQRIHRIVFTGIGFLPFFVIVAVGGCLCCCASCLYAGAGAVRGAYDDLAMMARTSAVVGGERGDYSPSYVSRSSKRMKKKKRAALSVRGGGGGVGVEEEDESSLLVPSRMEKRAENESEGEGGKVKQKRGFEMTSLFQSSKVREDVNDDTAGGTDDKEWWNTNEEESLSTDHEYEPLHDEEEMDYVFARPRHPSYALSSSSSSGSRHMACLFNACRICYIATIAVITLSVMASIRYFPKYPQYNVCSDNVAWKSIVDHMTSLKLAATFQILFSVFNPNHFDVQLDMGTGTFKHDGAPVGTFEIPTTDIAAMSITDVLVSATFAPDKWEALSLTSEYYKGTLKFYVDSKATVEIPSLMNYAFELNIHDVVVHVNDPKLSDRHLCVCPSWKDAKNHTNHTLIVGD